ncbi:ubiquitin-conjugating enzyme (macronuclear) [Tetrahymena thermophila SB210]|uniref:Ubiquitin-conjugating enzyme n=1 Tax=Tetrahymena thermophila (strain SB210) TaxID=312017 RepID=Q24HZ2_TETTS|nr:ubiquitin-conjugating enzyme [Tetrahymena thermophila SB210]EAS07446.2 ubiquitin-conjugating enzyme [Tetrahymena thermophila SB210]|eukprot:XP_001027688.2 ubiquitin-conjugating enzyme [Tetrahymena thermophila SB210]
MIRIQKSVNNSNMMICEEEFSQTSLQQNQYNQQFSKLAILSQKSSESKQLGYHRYLVNEYINLSKQNLCDETCSVYTQGYSFEEKNLQMRIIIQPHKGFFASFAYQINIIATRQYPYHPLIVQSQKKIFHPNFDQITNNLYLEDLDFQKWNPQTSLYMLILKIKWLFLEPKIDYIPENSHDCCLSYIYDKEDFKRKLNDSQNWVSNTMDQEESQQYHQIQYSIPKNFRATSCLVNRKKRLIGSNYNLPLIMNDYNREKIKLY